MKLNKRYDRVYYYVGGTEIGEWKECLPLENKLEDVYKEIARMGYIVVYGCSDIGRPEGPPMELLDTQKHEKYCKWIANM